MLGNCDWVRDENWRIAEEDNNSSCVLQTVLALVLGVVRLGRGGSPLSFAAEADFISS
jgi:hypothetical protein